jgi:hypothetical protein
VTSARDRLLRRLDLILGFDLVDRHVAVERVCFGDEDLRVGWRVRSASEVGFAPLGPPLARVDAALARIEDDRVLGSGFDVDLSLRSLAGIGTKLCFELLVAPSTVSGGRMASIADESAFFPYFEKFSEPFDRIAVE